MNTSNELERLGLTGRTVTGLSVGPDEAFLVFHLDDFFVPNVVWDTDADCCSETWFADVINLAALLNHPVLSVTQEFIDDPDCTRSRQEHDVVGAITITTLAGDCRVEWRNSSNGYYGGSVCRLAAPSDPSGCVPITHDWRAP